MSSILSVLSNDRPVTLILSEKRFYSLRMIDSLNRLRENPQYKNFIEQQEVIFVDLCGFGLWRFDFPESIKAKDLPLVHMPRYRFGSYGAYMPSPILYSSPETQFPKVDQDGLSKLLQRANTIVQAMDPGARGAIAFHLALTNGCWEADKTPINPKAKVLDLCLTGLELDKDMASVLDGSAAEWPLRSQKRLNAGIAKEFFDYNYAINNAAVMEIFLKNSNANLEIQGKRSITTFQKFSLQLLLWMNKNKEKDSWTLSNLLQKMSNWTKDPDTGYTIELGSPASQHQIIENLILMGLLEEFQNPKGKTEIRVSSIGKDFCELMPKDAYDPHLPKRLLQWMVNWPDTLPSIQKYTRVFWSKIRNKKDLLNNSLNTKF